MSESSSTGSQQQPVNKPPAANIIVQPQQVAQLPNAANPNIRYPLYVQAIPGGSSPMIYSAVVGPGGVSNTPQLVQWKTTSSAAHHPAPNVTMLPAMAVSTATQQTSSVNSVPATHMLAGQNLQTLPPGLIYSVGGMPFAAGGGINLAAAPVALIPDQSKKEELGKGRESPGVMLVPPGKRIKPEHSHSNNPSPGPRPRSAESPSAVTLATAPATGTAFIVPSVTPAAAAAAAMVTSKPQQWRNAGMKFISYTPTTVTTTTATAHHTNTSSFKTPAHMMPTTKQIVMTTSNLTPPSSKAPVSSDAITIIPKPTSLSQTISATMRIFLPAHLMLVIIPCFGYIPDFLFHVKTHLHISDCLQHLFKPCYAAMSNSTCYAWSLNITDTPLNPESCALLTISYLTSLRPGEIVLAEDLRRYLYNAQCGELEWLEYYKKNKKMSENPFVQSFLMHLSRIVIYCASKQVRIMISNTSLTDGIIYSLKNLSQMASDRQKMLPNFVVVLALRQDSPLEFCIISANPLQVKALIEYEIGRPADRIRELLMKKRGRTHSPSSVGIPGSISSRSNKYSLKKSHSYNLTFEKKPLVMSKDVLASLGQVRKQLNGKVLVPFSLPADSDKGVMEDKVSLDEAEKMIPPFPHIVEHLPSGPFQEQYNVALCLMQQISNADKNPGLSSYRKVDFSFLVPSDKLLYSELVSKIESFSIVAQLNICKPVVEKVKRETVRRVICLTNARDQEKLFRLSTRASKETQTLFVVIVENAHMFHQELFKAMLNDTSNNIVQTSFETLMVAENVFFISVTSFPYSLISNHSMIPFSNEIYWQKCQSINQASGKKLDNQCQNMTFCSSDDYLTDNHDNAAADNSQVSYREDVVFEEQFQNVCCNAKEVDSSMDSLRAQLLLEQYVGAILTAAGHVTTKRIVSPDTQLMINDLINTPLTNHKGQGLMVLLRCPDEAVGQDIYQQLKVVRDLVGLQYRFELIYNNTMSELELDKHFMRRLHQWKYGCVAADQTQLLSDNQWQPNCFKDLENLPCVVILAGVCRSGLSFPRSLRYVDLRLCYSNNITRTVLEADMSYFNGYQQVSPLKQTKMEKEENKENSVAGGKEKEVIDLSLDEESASVSNEGSAANKISTKRLIIESSSSSRRSSVADDNERDKGEATNGKIVEWKPSNDDEAAVDDDKNITKPVHSPDSVHSDSTLDGDEVIEVVSSPATPTAAAASSQNDGQEEPMQASPTTSEHSGNASDYETEDADVTPPASPAHITSHDHGESDDKLSESTQHMVTDESTSGQGSMDTMDTTDSQESSQEADELLQEQKVTSTAAKTKWDEYVNDMMKRIEENESDYSDEDCYPNKRVYLLSRTYHQIWNVSDYFNKRFLLEPAPGMEWSRSSKRPPLFDCDPQVQAAYYRKWATPTIIQCCEHCVLMSTSKKLVRSLGNVEKSGDRRFLLTGPAQVGKTGACLLLLRLLHDLTLSAHGVMVKNEPIAKKYLKQLKNPSAEPAMENFDFEVHEYFKTKHFSKIYSVLSLCNERSPEQPEEVTDEEKDGAEPTQQQPVEPKTEAYLSLSFNCAYDPTHSCNGCVLYMCRPHNSSTDTGIIRAEFTIEGPTPVTFAIYIPMSQRKLFDIKTCSVTGKITVQRFILFSDATSYRKNSKQVITPIFTPTFNRQAHALLNLHHAIVGAQHVHILVMNASQVANYQKVWPNHIILILPEGDKSQGYGPSLYWIKLFATHNYTLNCTAMAEQLSSKGDQLSPTVVWPWIIIMSDSCVMWKKSIVEPNGTRRYASSSLAEVIQSVERSIEAGMSNVAAIGFLQWSKEIKDVPTVNMTSNCQISHSFVFLDLSKTTSLNYNQFNYNSADLDFNLRVVSEGLQLLRDNRFLVVKKKLDQGGNMYPSYLVQKLPNTPQSDIDQMVFSLHYDALRLLPFPGPYLMEEYLINRSTTLFPNAVDKHHPVLVFENFVNLGPEINIVYIGAKTVSELDKDHPTEFRLSLENIQFGGLLLYLSEGKINIVNRLLPFLNFVNGATLCLITRDCKSLVKEKARLDIENKWRFQAKGEHQTACPDDHRPLFFLTGHLVQDPSAADS